MTRALKLYLEAVVGDSSCWEKCIVSALGTGVCSIVISKGLFHGNGSQIDLGNLVGIGNILDRLAWDISYVSSSKQKERKIREITEFFFS